jgi:methyltransferase
VNDFAFFSTFYTFILCQRGVELMIARKNEKWMMDRGAVEFGKEHYRFIVMIHALFFVAFLGEKLLGNRGLSLHWPWLLSLFILTQMIRAWIILSLGRHWNTKIIVLPDASLIRKGPYRFMKHPNYAVVQLEFLLIPLLFEAYVTAGLFIILNAIVLSIRISAEEKALKQLTQYEEKFQGYHRFLSRLLKNAK